MIKYLIVVVSVLLSSSGYSQATKESIDELVHQTVVRGHLEYLASDALRGRDTGSEGLEAAAAYIASQFRRYGVEQMDSTYFQSVPFVRFSPPQDVFLSAGTDTLSFGTDFIVLNGHAEEVMASSVYIGHGQDNDILNVDVQGKIAVSIAGDGITENPRDWANASREKRKRLIAAGAVGLIEIYQSTNLPWRFLRRFGSTEQLNLDTGDDNTDLFTIWVGTTDTDRVEKLKNGVEHIHLRMDGVRRTKFRSDNVMGIVKGTDPDLAEDYMVFSAHYDHVGIGNADAKGDTIYNGTRDNAVGTTGVLCLSEYFAHHPPKRSAIFVLFTAEEKGLLGSRYFTDNLPVPADQIKYNFNIDNGGYNDTTIISVIGLTRTTVEEEIQIACNQYGLTAIEDPAKEQGLFDRSDNVNFARLGIPAPTFSLGFRAFDEEIFKYYHRPGDHVETIDMDYVTKYVKSYILSSDKIINRSNVPFWSEGDKYFKVGETLYGSKP